MEQSEGSEHVRAYIRIAAFDPKDLLSKNWFTTFYDRIKDLVKAWQAQNSLCVFAWHEVPTDGARAFLDSFKSFAEEIREVDSKRSSSVPGQLLCQHRPVR